jgi:hypothetical protein
MNTYTRGVFKPFATFAQSLTLIRIKADSHKILNNYLPAH